jgi:hypothetical protein
MRPRELIVAITRPRASYSVVVPPSGAPDAASATSDLGDERSCGNGEADSFGLPASAGFRSGEAEDLGSGKLGESPFDESTMFTSLAATLTQWVRVSLTSHARVRQW